ncbi:S8 family serine peptidase [Bradyrhizobium diazoefficiens]|uniref:S8 family serine peptidase n=1 Tax=Bradyrhizobium diazoefficiens TaxID=1355477 RepID=UPI0005770672|nr:S8 family serine peptidase [Bradyrhizobium diazoefficiens]
MMRAAAVLPTLLLVAALEPAICQTDGEKSSGSSQADTDKDKGSSFQIEFLGKDPSADWAKTVLKLMRTGDVPTSTLTLEKGQDPCNAVLQRLQFDKFHLGCSDGMKEVIRQLNPSLPSPSPIGQLVIYPDLPITKSVPWRAAFDSAIPEENDRLVKVRELWKGRKTGEKTAGSQRTLGFEGVAVELKVPTSPENYKWVEGVENFNKDIDRFETRAVAKETNPVAGPKFSNTPIDWAESCNAPPIPITAAPPYISLLNATDNPTCSAACSKPGNPSCPEIVLVDQAVDPHPDLISALRMPNTAPANNWCPFKKYDATKNHGTHLAGIMVSAGAATGFKGLAPNVSLDSQPITDPAIKKLLDSKANLAGLKIYVYAGKFKNDYSITTLETRRHKPPQVEDILASQGLWVVAAGQQEPVIDIGRKTTDSPMNLGDQKNVIVVTACDDCYGSKAAIPDWANYSTEGLVTVAAPGGSGARQIPSTIDASSLGLAYGTSQSTALVAGLLAEMASCFPQRYVNGALLKQRLEAIAKPAPTEEMSSKVSAGVVDATFAYRDPDAQLLKLAGDTVKSAKNLWFCTDNIRLRSLADDEELEIGPIPVKRIRGIYKQIIGNQTGWRVKYQLKQGEPTSTSPLVKFMPDASWGPDKPFFYVDGSSDLPARPILVDEVETLIPGLAGGSIPPAYQGCK